MKPDGDGTDLLIFGEFVPRNILGTVLIRTILGPEIIHRTFNQARLFEKHLSGQEESPFPQLAAPNRQPPKRLLAISEELIADGLDPTLVGRLRHHMLTSPDLEAYKVRPFELADLCGC